MKTCTEVATEFYDKRFPGHNRKCQSGGVGVGLVSAGMAEVLAAVRDRDGSNCYLNLVQPCPELGLEESDWCGYCWASAELEKLKGEP